nr:hypothetical protein [Tanacetum cinerariifolium]
MCRKSWLPKKSFDHDALEREQETEKIDGSSQKRRVDQGGLSAKKQRSCGASGSISQRGQSRDNILCPKCGKYHSRECLA